MTVTPFGSIMGRQATDEWALSWVSGEFSPGITSQLQVAAGATLKFLTHELGLVSNEAHLDGWVNSPARPEAPCVGSWTIHTTTAWDGLPGAVGSAWDWFGGLMRGWCFFWDC